VGAAPVPQRLVIVAPSTVEFDSRTRRIAAGLAGRGHAVTVIARWGEGLPAEETLAAGERIVRPRSRADRTRPASSPASVGRSARLTGVAHLVRDGRRMVGTALGVLDHRRVARKVDPGADIYHGMAFMGIPIALDLARRQRAKAIYDVRDIYLDSTNLSRLPGYVRAVLARLERGWARRADRVLTVNDACADLLARRMGVRRPAVIYNAPPRRAAPDPASHRFHDVLGLSPGTPVVLYQGGFVANRGLDTLLEAMAMVPAADLVLLGYGPLRDELLARAADPALGGRVHVLPAVPPEELADWVACADVGVMPNQPRTLNERLSTPNKLFESLAVGLPVVSSDFPERRRIVIDDPDGPLGAVSDPTDPAALAAAIRSILEQDPAARADLRARCLKAAHERWNWETELERLLGVYGELTGKPW